VTSIDEKVQAHLDRVLKGLERESTREVIVTEDGSTKRLELRSVRWTRWVAAGPFLLVALWILAGAVLSLFQNHEAARQAVSPVLVSVSLAFISLVIVSVRESILISSHELVLSSGLGRFKVTTRVPLAAIREVRVGAFSFASWDPYVVVATEHRRYRLAWSVSERGAHEIARAILHALPTGG
jgi:hypothetical protein